MFSAANGTGAEADSNVRELVAVAVDRLVAMRNTDGSFPLGGAGPGNVGITAIAGLALLSDGQVGPRDRHGDAAAAAVRFVVESADESGLLCDPATASPGPMFEHGYAVRLLAEARGEIALGEEDDPLGAPLEAAVRLIERGQSASGGWRYLPGSGDADVTVTACQLLALRAAAGADVVVDREVIEAGLAYLERCRNGDGGFRYRAETPGPSGYARTAIAAAAGLAFAEPPIAGNDDPTLAYLRRELDRHPPRRTFEYDLFGHWHAAEAARIAGGISAGRITDRLASRLRASRREPGDWRDAQFGDAYGTAAAILAMTATDAVLPAIPSGPIAVEDDR